MTTTELSRAARPQEDGLAHRALTMAVGIVVERVQTLSPEDKNDLYELLKELVIAPAGEDRDSIANAMMEILEQRPVQVKQLALDTEPAPPVLQKWIDFVSGRIRERRKSAGFTQEELAQKAGLPQSHISRLESGKHSPSRTTIEKIAAALNARVEDFDSSA